MDKLAIWQKKRQKGEPAEKKRDSVQYKEAAVS